MRAKREKAKWERVKQERAKRDVPGVVESGSLGCSHLLVALVLRGKAGQRASLMLYSQFSGKVN